MTDSIFKQIGAVVGAAVTDLNNRVDHIEITNNLGIPIIDEGGIGVIDTSIVPSTNVTYDLGSPTKMWKDIYVGPGSLYVNGQKVLQDNSGTITISADLDQNVQIKTSGSGDIEFYPSGTGVLQMKGTVSLLAGTNLTTSDGQPINCPAGFSNLTIQNLTVTGTTTTVNTENVSIADNILTLNSNVIGTPSENAGIEVERGDENNAKILYNETLDAWQFTNDGSTYLTLGNVEDHEHTIYDISGLQTALDNKVDDSQVLTNVPVGAVFTDTVYTHPATHSISEVDGLQLTLDGKLSIIGNAATASKLITARTISLTGDVTGSAIFDGSGNISISTTASGGGATVLNDLTDVDLTTTTPVEGSYLRYDGTKWVPVDENIGSIKVLTPGITNPIIGATLELSLFSASTTVFQSVGNDIHESTDWQISTDISFNNIIFESLNDATNKESINLSNIGLSPDTQYYIRVKHNGLYDNDENWSAIVNFKLFVDGEQIYTTPGTYSWECPSGVTNVSVVCIGGGGSGWLQDSYAGGGGGGGLGWKNNITVIPGNLYTVVVGTGGSRPLSYSDTNCGNGPGEDSFFIDTFTVKGGGGLRGERVLSYTVSPDNGGTFVGDGGGKGGSGGANYVYCGGGGGAGGYIGYGGNANVCTGSAALESGTLAGSAEPGSGGGGAGGGGYSEYTAGSGGGVGLFGVGIDGAGGINYHNDGGGGYGGSGGTDAAQDPYNGYTSTYNTPGLFGGGSGGSDNTTYKEVAAGASGAVRIIWGNGRSFPSNAN